jgi:uncharacterized repeat protein (TIGR02059 family)
VVYGDIITFAYTKPATNPLQTASGGAAASISAKSVTNNCIPPVPVYISSVVENATPTTLDMTYNIALANIVPVPSSFNVRVNLVTRTVNSVAIVGGKVRLTLASPAVYGNRITVAYSKPASNPLQTASGGAAASFSAKSVTNNCVANIPVYVSSVIEDATPAILEMTYNLSLANIIPPITAFSVNVNSVTRIVSSVAIVGGKVRLTLASAVVNGDIVDVAYSIPVNNPLQSVSGAKASSIDSQSVTNNCGLVIPTFVSSVIENSTPTILEMTYDISLANIVPATTDFYILVNSVAMTVDLVNINGTNVQLTLDNAVVFGDLVTITYNKPVINPLQATYGGEAENIIDQRVTNNCTPVIPIYVSSYIDTLSPTILEMTYDLGLVNIVPATSAFDVQVNSVSRTINSVAIIGGKVLLSLSSVVVFGDIVTVDYTRPAGNPLQTSSGGMAASFNGQSVTNNCASTIPNYINSFVENATPAILEMTYDLTLANMVPAASAFNVQVNSVSRTVNSVAIVGGKVQLTLSSEVVFGDIVTVDYTRPAGNPLQTSSGGLAASISGQSVTNNCQDKPNDPPVLVVNNEADGFSGFVYELDASGSYDLNNDILIYEWILPDNVSASSTSSSKIQFLAPIVSTSQNLEFQLSVTDGKVIASKTITINIMPYKPELTIAKITNIEASDYQVSDFPNNVKDDNLTTKWSVNGDNQWLIFTLDKLFKISYLEVAFLQGQEYESFFDIYASADKLNWDPILINAASCNFSGDFQVFDSPASETNTEYTYVKLVGHGSKLDGWNNFSEFKIFGSVQDSPASGNIDIGKTVIYPNPAQSFFNITIEEPIMEPNLIRIIDFSGKIVFEKPFNSDIKTVQIPDNLNSGMYIVELRSGTITLDTQKLIIKR